MKKRFSLVKVVSLGLLFMSFGSASAQWGGGGGGSSLPLVAETDFSVSGGDDDYWHSMDMVDGFGNSAIMSTLKVGSGFSEPESTESTAKASAFLGSASYAVTPNPVRLDSLRMYDNKDSGEWGVVFSAGKTSVSKKLALSFSVAGLKNGGEYRVEVEYCNPHAATYLNTDGANKNPHLSGNYQSQIKVGTNNTQIDGAQTTALGTTAGSCKTATVSTPASATQSQGFISGNKLDVNIIIDQMAAGEAIMIKSIKIYAEVDIKITGENEACAGGEIAALSLSNSFLNAKYQWYKVEGGTATAISGANKTSFSHASGNTPNKKTSYYCEITTLGSTKPIKTETFTVTDIECCTDEKGNPSTQKLIWMDDFGTFTSATNYWVWDYTDIANPKKVQLYSPNQKVHFFKTKSTKKRRSTTLLLFCLTCSEELSPGDCSSTLFLLFFRP